MWALDVTTPSLETFSNSSFNPSNQKEDQQHRNCTQHAILNPPRDAGRIAALKKLRHLVVALSSASVKKPGGKPLPILYFERWLARYALRRESALGTIRSSTNSQTKDNDFRSLGDDDTSSKYLDPLIPSDGIVDNGLIQDLSRSIPSQEAKTIATTLAQKSQQSAANLRESHPNLHFGNGDDPEDYVKKGRKRAKKTLKEAVKKIKHESKAVQLALDKVTDQDEKEDAATSNTSDDAHVLATLINFRAATQKLEEIIQKAQKEVVKPISCTSPCGGISINGTRREGIYDVTVKGPNGKPNRPYLTVSRQHLCKLIQLWTIEQQHKDGDDDSQDYSYGKSPSPGKLDFDFDPIEYINNNTPKCDQPQLRMAIYSCLSRYEALRGAGYQCALPGVAFDAAASKCGLGVTIECFASPLNCRYRRFCSAFPDIETRFGSIGSFFDDEAFDPQQGSFEANPPFVPETMNAMGTKIQRLLSDKDRGPLSFLVVVPAWGAGSEFHQRLLKSKHTRASALIEAADHAYFDGSQHTKLVHTDGSLLRPSSWDTAVLLLQNDAGKTTWSVDDCLLKQSFCEAFKDAAKSLPKELSTVEKWEGRGVSRGGSLKQRGLPPKRKRSSK